MATSKQAKKRTSQLRKAHSHIKAPKTRTRRPEVDELLGVTAKPTTTVSDTLEKVLRANGPTVARLAEENNKPGGLADGATSKLTVHLDLEAIRSDVASSLSLSPLEKAACDLNDALFAYEGLITSLNNRLASVLKEERKGIIGHAERIETGIPFVDGLNKRVSALEKSNTALRDLIGRIAV